ncbi:MAG: ArsR/SmtB family transcription factor [Gemmatimonadota bacterium]
MTDTISTGALDARFQALSDEKRLRILELLRDGEECVCELTEAMEVSQSLLSFHLKKLKEAGLVRDRREGRWAYYRLNTEGLVELRDRLDELAGTGEAIAGTPPYRCC